MNTEKEQKSFKSWNFTQNLNYKLPNNFWYLYLFSIEEKKNNVCVCNRVIASNELICSHGWFLPPKLNKE